MTTATSTTAERAELRSIARAVLAEDDVTWRQYAELGWLALAIPEADGGSGGSPADLAVVLAENGRVLGPGNLASANLAGLVLASAHEAPLRMDHLSRIAAGSCRATLAATVLWAGSESWPVATGHRSGYRLRGRLPFVADAVGADLVLAPALLDGDQALIAVDPAFGGVDVTPLPTMDRTRRFATVTLGDVDVAPGSLIARPATRLLEQARALAAFTLACDSLGGAEASLDATVTYLGARHQFGQAIGAFQALQHRCADMLITLEGIRAAVERAAAELAAGDPGWAWLAKWRAADGYAAIAGESVQLHGGIGFTWEHGLHRFLKRAKLNQALYGDPSWHRRRVGQWTVESC